MAYTDLVSSQVTVVADAATDYTFAFDTPVSQDGSPHIVSMGFQLDGLMNGATTPTGTMGKLITSLRIKVGSNIVVDWNSPITYGAASSATLSVAQSSVLAQALGGEDYFASDPNEVANRILSGFSLPMGLEAGISQRVNVSIGLGDVSDWCNATWTSAELNVVLHYGTAKEATIVGAAQQFEHSENATRIVTIFGKTGWQMLGVLVCNNQENDEITEIRVNNGQFRALKPDQWRALFGRFGKNPLRALDSFTGQDNTNPNYLSFMKGCLFLDLRRITAGSPIDISVETSAEATLRYIPIYVASINAKTSTAPAQSAKQVQSTTGTVVGEGSQN